METNRRQALAGDAFRFGDYELDTVGRRLERGGEEIPLQPRIYTLLEFFVRHPGVAFSRDELMEELWPGVIVSDQSLTEAVSRLRGSLEDSSSSPEYIETIRGYGFRFTATVEGHEGAAVPETVWPPLWKLALPGAGLSGLLLFAALAAGLLQAGFRPIERVALAELTFPDGSPVRDWAAELSPDEERIAFVRSDPPRLIVMELESEATSDVASLERVWAGRQLRWAPDGAALAYSDQPESAGSGVVDLFSLPSGDRARLLTWDAGSVSVLGWDLAGEQLLVYAFDEAEAEPELLLLDRSGDLRGRWSAGVLSEGRVSPDGRWLAVSAYSGAGSEEIAIVPVEQLWTDPASVAADRFRDWGDAARILEPPVDDDAPRWSPDSRRLLFFSWQGGDRALWTVEVADGAPVGQPRPIAVPGAPYQVQGWTADGQIFFSSYHTDSDSVLLPVDPASAELTGRPTILSIDGGKGRGGLWSSDPNRIIYSSRHEDRIEGDLYLAELDPETGLPDRGRTRIEIDGRFVSAAWSMDGERLYYSMRVPGGGWGLFEQELASGVRTRLLPGTTFGWAPWPSSDRSGRYLLLNAEPKNPNAPAELETLAPGRYLFDRVEGRLSLVDDVAWSSSSLSPDASWASAPTAEGSALEAFELGSGERRLLANAPGGGWDIVPPAAISPDGNWVAYLTQRQLPESLCPETRLWIVDATGRAQRHVQEADEWSPSYVFWSPDGSRLAITSWICRDSVMRFAPAPSR